MDRTHDFQIGDRVMIARIIHVDSQGRDCDWPGPAALCGPIGPCTVIEILDEPWPEIPIRLDGPGGRAFYSPEALDMLP